MKPQLQSSFSKLPDHKFIKTNSLVAITIYFIISSIFLTYGIITSSTSFLLSVSVVFTGIFFFTFIEYIFHRFVYHSGKDYMDEKNWQFKVHGIHHAFPKNKNILALPLILAFVILSIFYSLFYLTLGNLANFFFPGFLSAYALYLYIHYRIHTSMAPKNVFRYLWVHHHKHHHISQNKAFGLTSPFWDMIFNTMPPKSQRTN
jgi:4-hydroxysphinganine ceramide fatty acyl 2-hydroxylase